MSVIAFMQPDPTHGLLVEDVRPFLREAKELGPDDMMMVLAMELGKNELPPIC